MRESDVIIRFTAATPAITDERLENDMFAALDALELYASELALGPVTAVDFDNRAIEIAFSLCHDGQADATEKISQVLGIIEKYTNAKVGDTDAHIRGASADAHDDDPSLQLVC